MKKFVMLGMLALVSLLLVGPLPAWEEEGHNHVTAHAVTLLPEPLHSVFKKHKGYLQAHDLDPDRWKPSLTFEGPLHFIDLDKFGTPPHFEDFPRGYNEAVQKFGKEPLDRNGTVPWAIERRYQLLVTAFRNLSRRPNDQPLFEAAMLSHYVGDCHVPFHACLNYDGQLTGQRGLHHRFEGEIVRRYLDVKSLPRLQLEPVEGPIHVAAFGWAVESFALVDPLLKADAEARAAAGDYNEAYYEAFRTTALPIARQRIAQAAARLAALWSRAWEEAGKPDLQRIVVVPPPA